MRKPAGCAFVKIAVTEELVRAVILTISKLAPVMSSYTLAHVPAATRLPFGSPKSWVVAFGVNSYSEYLGWESMLTVVLFPGNVTAVDDCTQKPRYSIAVE